MSKDEDELTASWGTSAIACSFAGMMGGGVVVNENVLDSVRPEHDNSNYIRVHKVISVANFTMKQSDLQLSDIFLKALNHLPLEYNYTLYSRIFDDFGTHYYTSGKMGGSYDILYQYSSEELKNSGLAVDESVECVRTETTRHVFFWKKKKVSTRCTTNRMTVKHEGSILESAEQSVSLVKGGRSEYTAALAWEKKGAFPGHAVFTMLESTKDNPMVTDFEAYIARCIVLACSFKVSITFNMPDSRVTASCVVSSAFKILQLTPSRTLLHLDNCLLNGCLPGVAIMDLVKNVPWAVTRPCNLRRALREYVGRFDPCQCASCPSNGRSVLSRTECLCLCQCLCEYVLSGYQFLRCLPDQTWTQPVKCQHKKEKTDLARQQNRSGSKRHKIDYNTGFNK
ncbi:LOW QUALITY PROTEIN: complement component C6-like [Morphnus guianensis]